MKHTLSFPSFCRIVARERLDAGGELQEDDKTIWTVAEVIEQLSGLPPDAPVIISTECDEEQDMLFWFDPCEDDDGNKALFIRVDMREMGDTDDAPNAEVTGLGRNRSNDD
jgi:hypothetical protein